MSSRDDQRSVGELLLDSELIARQTLFDTEQADAAAMLRTWGEVVQCAAELWQSLPPADDPRPTTTARSGTPTSRTPPSGAGSPDDALMVRLEAITMAMHRTSVRRGWPGAGPADERLLRIAENLSAAADMVRGHQPSRPITPAVSADLTAAKARLMHTLYIGCHGVAVAVRNHEYDLQAFAAGKHRVPPGQSLAETRHARQRLAAFEALAGSYVGRTYPDDIAGEHRAPPDAPRLGLALATWDVQAHRTLAATTSLADLMLASHTQAMIGDLGHDLLRGAAATGAIDSRQYATRLAPAVARTQAAWTHLASLWRDLTPPSSRRGDPVLDRAANEVRAALLEIAHDRTRVAEPAVMASRVNLRDTTRALQQSLFASVDLAHVIREATANPQLLADARSINAIATRRLDAPLVADDGVGPLAAWVSVQDLLARQQVPLPEPLRGHLTDAADRTIHSTNWAIGASAFIDQHTASSMPIGVHRPTHEPQPPPGSMKIAAPSPGCER